MKLYISVDFEGAAGVTAWDEVTKGQSGYNIFSPQMTEEVKAACEGAVNSGVNEIWVKDAHDDGKNIDITQLPHNVHIIRGWSGSPLSMMQELDDSFDAVLMIGYHSFSGSNESPVSHTLSTKINYLKINGEYASEFLVNTYAASFFGVPVVFVSGDEGLCKHILEYNRNIQTVKTKTGVGNSVISRHPDKVKEEIKNGVEKALKGNLDECKIDLPAKFKVEISYAANYHYNTYKASFYPGMKQVSPTSVLFETDDYFEVLRMLLFNL